MNDWRTISLADLVRFRNGKSTNGIQPGPYPVYGSNGIIGTAERPMYDNAIIFGRVGAYCGSVEYCPGQFWATDNTIVVEPHAEHLNVRFAEYMFRLADLHRYAGGSAQPLLTQTNLKALSFTIPPLETQHRIASILGAYDDLIELNRRRVAVLEEMARGLFEEWFVRFRFPGHEGVAIIETPEGPLPAGWHHGPLGSLIRLNYGKALKADGRQPGKVSVIGSSGVVGEHDNALVNGPGIVVGRKGNVGSVIWSQGDFWPIDTTYFVETLAPLTFVYELLRRIPFQNTDAAVPGLNRDYALSRLVVVPPVALVDRFGAVVDPLRTQVETIAKTNTTLAASRDLLLPRLISGQLSVEAAERELEVAA